MTVIRLVESSKRMKAVSLGPDRISLRDPVPPHPPSSGGVWRVREPWSSPLSSVCHPNPGTYPGRAWLYHWEWALAPCVSFSLSKLVGTSGGWTGWWVGWPTKITPVTLAERKRSPFPLAGFAE